MLGNRIVLITLLAWLTALGASPSLLESGWLSSTSRPEPIEVEPEPLLAGPEPTSPI
jgi:hypothetical protein